VRSPVGVLRFDLATNRDSDTIRLHFSLGVKF
jgi:outer membrane translocation and assembly module TamA